MLRNIVWIVASALTAAVPPGWFLAGTAPQNYDTGVDPVIGVGGQPGAYLTAKASADPQKFGTLMQQFRADSYRSKRVRFSAFVKAEAVEQWAGLWMRIDDGREAVAFDNMQNRPIKGTLNWQNYSVVLDVPESATSVNFGILLGGRGSVWMSGTRFETVGENVPVTGSSFLPQPRNLNFEGK